MRSLTGNFVPSMGKAKAKAFFPLPSASSGTPLARSGPSARMLSIRFNRERQQTLL